MDNSDFSKIDDHFLKIFEDLKTLTKEIEEINIPTRSELVRKLFIKKLEETGLYFSGIMTEREKTLQESESIVNSSKAGKINSMLKDIEINPEKRDTILKKIFDLIDGISGEDKNVLFDSLKNLEYSILKNSVLDIISTFLQDLD
jgi:hypothetical protein